MSALTFGSNWESITKTITGAATIVESGGVLTCTSIAGDNAKAVKILHMKQGDMVRVSVMCRRVIGALPIGGISINNLGDKARVFCDSEHWERLECSYSLPLTATDFDTVNINLGVFTSEDGSVEYADPRIDIFNSAIGQNRTIACGLIGIASGTPTVNTGFTSHGILSMSYAANELSITIPRSTGASYSSPLFFVESNGGGVAAAADLIAKQTTYSAVTGIVKIKFYDTVTNAFIDISTIASMFMFFKAEIN